MICDVANNNLSVQSAARTGLFFLRFELVQSDTTYNGLDVKPVPHTVPTHCTGIGTVPITYYCNWFLPESLNSNVQAVGNKLATISIPNKNQYLTYP